MKTRRLTLYAPLAGVVHPIQEVPDPIFAQKMAGEGVAIEPTTQSLLAPAEGMILDVHPAKHAVSMRTNEGVELLLHIGLDTVMLRGEGFYPQVDPGDKVSVGQTLIDFDADQLALKSRSLLTEVVITNPEIVSEFNFHHGRAEAADDPIMTLELGSPTAEQPPQQAHEQFRAEPVNVTLSHGLHARPAAALAHEAKRYPAKIQLRHNNRHADMKSVVSLIGLNVRCGDSVELQVSGHEAQSTLQKLHEHLRATVAGPDLARSENLKDPTERSLLIEQQADDGWLHGVAASPGIVAGPIFQLVRHERSFATEGEGAEQELDTLSQALASARIELEALQRELVGQDKPERAAIFSAHAELLDDPVLYEEARHHILAGKSAAYAWEQSIKAQVAVVSRLDNPTLAARAADLSDVGKRALNKLLAQQHALKPPRGAIVITDELTPSEAIELERQNIAGICTLQGSETSHVALLARSMALPAIVGIDEACAKLPNDTLVLLDGIHGRVNIQPSEAELNQLKRVSEQLLQINPDDEQPIVTSADGAQIKLLANVASVAEARRAAEMGCCGIGLLRTEFLYLERELEPTVEEQCHTLLQIHEQFPHAEAIVVRTLDIGGDKNLPYLPQGHEINPDLGLRGIRYGLHHPGVLRRQVRAILQAAKQAPLSIMLPMVSGPDEVRTFKRLLQEECDALGLPPVPCGIMVELPSAALKARQLAAEVDFFSIGTNDLAQYALAIDRGHAKLARQLDSLDPAVLRLIDMTVRGAAARQIPVSLCGNIAADPTAIPVLLGLGLRQLSFTPSLTQAIRQQVMHMDLAECEALAQQVLILDSAKAVREAIAQWQMEKQSA